VDKLNKKLLSPSELKKFLLKNEEDEKNRLIEIENKKIEEEKNNKRLVSPKDLLDPKVEEVVEEYDNLVEEVVEEDPIEILYNKIEDVASSIPEQKSYDKEIAEIREDINSIVIPEVRYYDDDIEEIKENINSIEIPEVKYYDDEIKDIEEKINNLELSGSELKDNIFSKIEEVKNDIVELPEIRHYESELEDLSNAVQSIRESIPEVPEVKYYDEELSEIVSNIDKIKESINELPEVKYYDEQIESIQEKIKLVEGSIPEIPEFPEVKYYDKEIKNIFKDISNLKKYTRDLKETSKSISKNVDKVANDLGGIEIPEQIDWSGEIESIKDKIEKNNHKVENKIKHFEEVFNNINEEKILNESSLSEPPSTDNEDTLTPLDKNFVTFDQLKEHYKIFINRVQQQMASIGGGGETRLEFLDDVDRNSAKVSGNFLKYDSSSGKWIGSSLSSISNVAIGTDVEDDHTLFVYGNSQITETMTVGTESVFIDGVNGHFFLMV
jgi:soluble cytochrome b562